MSQIITIVSGTFGTVVYRIRGLYSRLVISDRCKVRNYPNRILSKSCRPPAGAGGQWAELGRKLRQTPHPFFSQGNLALRPRFLRTLFPFGNRIGPYNPVANAPYSLTDRWYLRPHLNLPLAQPIYG